MEFACSAARSTTAVVAAALVVELDNLHSFDSAITGKCCTFRRAVRSFCRNCTLCKLCMSPWENMSLHVTEE